MKPISKIQIEVDKIHSSLKPITKKQEEWAYGKFNNISQIIRNRFHCYECGHTYKLDGKWEELLIKIENRTTCPECKAVAKPHVGKLDYRRTIESFEFITTHKGWQVVRLMYGYKYIKRGEKSTIHLHEVMQHWINPNGKIVSYSKPIHFMTRYIDSFILYKDLELRNSSFKRSRQFELNGSHLYSKINLIPLVKRNGFNKKALINISTQTLIPKIITDSYCETLIKAKQYDLLKTAVYYPHQIEKYWKQIKIAIRNNYMVPNATNWFDHIAQLSECGKDIFNAKYICPKDLHAEHQKYLEKVRQKRRKEKLQKLIEQIEVDNEQYVQQKQLFFDLHFKYENITIDVMKSVQQVFNEGELLNHCVFENRYYEKQNSLLLSAKVDNEVVETIEVNLRELRINQARGKDNHPSEYNELIVNLVNQNLKKIKRVYNKYCKQAA